ncbi:MAG TPA: SUF system NifU family Fe-S cluster assembly protein [Clostridia bacterium]|jgi:SUF system NifU family Fe-S assembly protein
MSYFDESLSREIIMDHYQNPRGKSVPEGYKTITLKNVSCGDIVTVGALQDHDIIKDIRHEGTGCSICCASASMMCELLKEKSVPQALDIAQEFSKMMTRQDFDCEKLGDACALEGINKLLPRIKCATLAWNAVKELLTGEQKNDG